MILLLLFALVVGLLILFPRLRCIVFNLPLVLWYLSQDLVIYIWFKRWRECNSFGTIDMYCSDTSKVFGNGKTLSGVHYIRNIYKEYNGKKIYDFDEKKWIEQKIIILSNVMLKDVPYIHLYNVEQIINRHDVMKAGEIMIVFIDECGIIFNSRNFKDNIGQDLLNSMLTCRKKKFGMFLTAQRFNQVDALIRQLTSRVFMADKWWRTVVLKVFSGYDMEYCANIDMLKYSTMSYFATNKLFASYDTNQNVEDIKQKQKSGEMLTNKEILENQGNIPDGLHNVRKLSRKGKKVLV